MKIDELIQIIWAVSAVLLVVFVLLHSPKGDGIGGIGGQAQLFTSTKSAEKALNRITWILSIVFISLTIILSGGWLNISQSNPSADTPAPVVQDEGGS